MTASRILLAGLVSLLGASLLPAPTAQAADDWSVPAHATITVKGRGYGHGHGMSQYGAEGAARDGLTYKQIVKFYYPGTSWGTARGGVKVLISADTSKDVVVLARPGLRLRKVGTGKSWDLSGVRPKATRWRIKPVSGGRSEISYRTTGWHLWKSLDENAEFKGRGAVSLVLPGGAVNAYRGALRSARRDTVNILPLDRYLQGVVPLEVPALWHEQAVRAQAVAARTYAAYERAHPIAAHYQICDTTSCQVYGGKDAEHPASNAAVRATAGRVLTYAGAAAFTQFSSSNGGWAAAGSAPYLVAKKDPYDGWSGNPNHRWTTTLTDRAVEKAWPAIGNLTGIRFSGRDGHGQWGGRVGTVRLTGGKGTLTISGDDFRFGLGLRSEWINLAVAAARFSRR